MYGVFLPQSWSQNIVFQISWGTKQDDIPDSDLGAVVQDSQSHVDVEMPAEAADMNSIYEESLANVRDRIPVGHGSAKKVGQSIAEREQAAKMYYSNVKTNVLLAWVLSNVRFCFSWGIEDIDFRRLGTACLQHPKRAECRGCFWTRSRFNKNQGVSRVYHGFYRVIELCGTSIVFRSKMTGLITFSQRFVGSTLYLMARLITGWAWVDYGEIMDHSSSWINSVACWYTVVINSSFPARCVAFLLD